MARLNLKTFRNYWVLVMLFSFPFVATHGTGWSLFVRSSLFSIWSLLSLICDRRFYFCGIFVGGWMNVAAMIANGYRMPVVGMPSEVMDDIHFRCESPKLYYLCDNGVLHGFSVGDIVILTSVFVAVALWVSGQISNREPLLDSVRAAAKPTGAGQLRSFE